MSMIILNTAFWLCYDFKSFNSFFSTHSLRLGLGGFYQRNIFFFFVLFEYTLLCS